MLLVSALKLGLQSQGYLPEMFPVERFYRHWKNADGQLSLFQQCLKHQEIFCFADYPHHSVAVDTLKAPPEADNKDLACWRSVDLVETLLYLADRGHYAPVHELFKPALQLCPDVLVLALLQVQHNSPMSVLRQELLTTLMPIFLGNHPNSGIILHHAWLTPVSLLFF